MNFIIKYKKIAFVVIFIITLFCSLGLFKLKIDYDFDSYFDKTDSVYLFYTQTSQTFNIHQHTLIIVAFDYQTSIYDKIFLQKTDSICNQIANISGIEKAYFLTNAVEDKISPWGIQQTKIAPFKTQ